MLLSKDTIGYIGFLGAGFAGSYELPNDCAGSLTQFLWRSRCTLELCAMLSHIFIHSV